MLFTYRTLRWMDAILLQKTRGMTYDERGNNGGKKEKTMGETIPPGRMERHSSHIMLASLG